MTETYLTKAGLKKLQDEMKVLQKQKRQLIEEVNKAAAMGDLRENAEYHAAKEHLRQVGMRLTEVESKLSHVLLIDDLPVATGEARLGVQVTLEDLQTHEQCDYLLVGSEEADPSNGKLSIASPLGKSLLGRKEREEFTLTLPKAVANYRVVKIARPSE